MADKSFGVDQLDILGTATPTISAPNQLNLDAHTVAISTSVTVGEGMSAVNISATGITTITVPANANPHSSWDVVNNSASAYRFTGPGQDGAEDNPNNYLVRGQRYVFKMNASGHPFQIRVANGGAAYSDGVTNNGAQTGNVVFNVQHDAPAQLFYQCTSHGGMVGNIYIVGGPQVISGVVTATGFVGSGANLTNLPAQATIANNADNRIITGGSGVNLNGEANLTFDGSLLNAASNATFVKSGFTYLRIGSTDANGATLTLDGDSNGDGSGTDYCMIAHKTDGDLEITADNPANAANIIFKTNSTTESLRITSGGDLNVTGVGTFSGGVRVGYDTTYSPIQQAANTYYYTRFDQATSVSGSNIVNLATGSLKSSETIPVHNMTRQSDAGAHSLYNSSTTSGSVSRDMSSADPFAPKSYGLTMGTMFYSHTSGNNGSGVIHYGATSTGEHFFVRYKYNSNSILVGVDTDGSDNWSTAYQNDLMSDSNWYFLVVAVERNGTLLTSLNGAPLTPIRIVGTAPEPGNARFGLAGDAYGDNNSRHRYATAFWHRGVMSNELIAQEYAWLKTIWTGASLP